MRVAKFLPCAFLVWASLSLAARGQVSTITIPAGSPEDVALQQISNESDPAKRVAELNDFVQKFSSNPGAVAYGYWQLAQIASAANQFTESLADGDKALAAQPQNVEILAMQAGTAQQLKAGAKTFDYAERGGQAYNGITSAPKPAGMSDDTWQAQIADDRHTNQPSYEYLQATAFNVIAAEPSPKRQMNYIQRFNSAFPDSKYQDQISEYAILTLQKLDDVPNAIAYGEAVLAQKPDDLPALLMMANTYTQSKDVNLEKGLAYARHAVKVADADAPDADAKRKLSGGLAYADLGFALLKKNDAAAAIPELRHGAVLLKGNAAARAPVLFGLGQAYTKLAQYPEAKQFLNEAAQIPGPAQEPARDLLAKIIAAHH